MRAGRTLNLSAGSLQIEFTACSHTSLSTYLSRHTCNPLSREREYVVASIGEVLEGSPWALSIQAPPAPAIWPFWRTALNHVVAIYYYWQIRLLLSRRPARANDVQLHRPSRASRPPTDQQHESATSHTQQQISLERWEARGCLCAGVLRMRTLGATR